MLKLVGVNKYFYRHKKNEIHVINNTTLDFPDYGLIALLGPSGCGKTTLLNAIGGLDKINSGKIYLDGKKMPKTFSLKKDKMRVLNIGYIFQDYNLLENMSVYDNIALSLKMIGIKNKSEIKERVNYVLEKVDMYRYRNKPAGMLSGGEKQRVGIARAIVKNPSIIIADEPTGNLDSKNTIEIMNIIKSISKDKLVILVTHERPLAEFYASRIISLEDGKVIKDVQNEHSNELDYRIDNKIYLQDFNKKDSLNDEKHKVNIYSDNNEKLNLDIVIKNGNLYIKSNNINKIEVVDEDSNIEFIDGHYKRISKDDYEKSNFDLKELDNSNHKLKYTSIYNVITMIKTGIDKVYNYKLIKKILLFGFFVSAMFIVYAVSNIFGSIRIEDSKFLNTNREYVTINNAGNKINEYLELENNEIIKYMIPGDGLITVDIINESIYQFKYANVNIKGTIASNELVKNVIIGKNIQNENEIVLDKMLLDKYIGESEYTMININKYEDFIGRELKVNNMDSFKVVGISDENSPCIYMMNSQFINVIANSRGTETYDYLTNDINTNIVDYNLKKDKIELKQGRLPVNDYEVIVNIDNEYSMPLYKEIETKIGDRKLLVVGYYYSPYGLNELYTTTNTIKISNILNNDNITLYGNNKDELISFLKENGYNATDSYIESRNQYKKTVNETITSSVILASILLFISFIEIFLMIRASFLSRIKEIGIYRAIGVKKMDIYKMFLGEILVITTLACVPGYILMGAILKEITKISYLKGMFLVDQRVMIISIIIIYALNIIVGLLPISRVIRKTPHEILSRTDID